MKMELTREEFEVISGALTSTIEEYKEKRAEMHRQLSTYSERRENTYTEIIEAASRVYREKFNL